MSRVLLGKSFTFKDMAKVCAAIGAGDFGAYAVRVEPALYGTGNFVIKTGPAAARIKLVFGTIKWSFTTATNICTCFFVIVKFPAERCFRAFIDDDSFFFGGEWIQFFHGSVVTSKF